MSEPITKYNYSVPHVDQLEMTRKIYPRLQQITPVVFEWGELMTQVHKRHLWLCYADTYQDFCENNLGITRQRAYQIMSAWDVRKALPEDCQLVVDTETKARPLASIPPPQRAAVVREAVKEAPNGRPTARHIEEAVQRVTAPTPSQKPPAKEILVDETGWPVPDNLEKLFDRIPEVREKLTNLSSLRGMLRRVKDNRDVLWRSVNLDSVMMQVDQLFADIKEAIPYAVCPYCQGRADTVTHCANCKQRGVVSKFFWEHAIPEELKAVRQKSVKK